MDFFKLLPKLSLTAAQKERYENQIILLKIEHKEALAALEDRISKLEAENRDLRAKVEPVTQENKQLHAAIQVLQGQLRHHEEMEEYRRNENPPLPGADVGL